MTDKVLDEKGKLLPKYSPAIYFDSCVLIDYFLAEGLEFEAPESREKMEGFGISYKEPLLKLFQNDKRISNLTKLRRTLLHETNAFLVTSPLSICELIGWHSSESFKNITTDLLGASAVLKKGNKDIARSLDKTIDQLREERNANQGIPQRIEEVEMDGVSKVVGTQPWKDFWLETTISPSFLEYHGLHGIIVADIVNLNLKESKMWNDLEILSYLQMGMADIMHLLIANHLGCKWFATFDMDFFKINNCKRHIEESFGLSILTSVEEIINKLT